ncbi:P-loop containing nucleoside triphosphate hydrolase protein [Mariannaea sp. PMI_226]|nr:P-loop containing nucleoside triphosphate hydrolase protein [Mariannaea sp. PMI_226]
MESSFPPKMDLRPTDIVVAIMGMTGSGKSTFISLCTGEDVGIGHQLKSCTQNVSVYKCRWSSTVDIYLVDTPGFDDTSRSDTEVLQTIATWLTKSYTNNVKLNGMIYLHRITDPRIGGSARKNLFMFKKICGTDALHNVLLVTTMWELAETSTGELRETDLVNTEDFWGVLARSGAQVQRHNNSRESAMALLKRFVGKSQVTMSIQEEMVNEHKDLHETQAGMQLEAEILKATESLRKDLADTQQMMKQALEARDQESAEMLRQYEAETRHKFEMMMKEREELKVSLRRMHERQSEQEQKTAHELRRLRQKLDEKRDSQQHNQEQERRLKLLQEQEEGRRVELKLLRQELEENRAKVSSTVMPHQNTRSLSDYGIPGDENRVSLCGPMMFIGSASWFDS